MGSRPLRTRIPHKPLMFIAVIAHTDRDGCVPCWRALLERHLSTAELLDRLCPGRGSRCYCSLFECHAELANHRTPIDWLLRRYSHLSADQHLACMPQCVSGRRAIRFKPDGRGVSLHGWRGTVWQSAAVEPKPLSGLSAG